MYKPKQPEMMQSDINNQFLSRPNEGLQFGSNGQTYSGGVTGAAGKTFDNPRDESSYWDNDPTYKKMIAQMQSMPVGAARDALRKQIEDYRSNKFNVPKVPVASAPAPSAAPAATPPATLATTPAPAAPALTGSDLAEANRSKAIGAQGRSPTNTSPAQTPAAAAPAVPAAAPIVSPSPSPAAPTGVTVDQVNQLKKRYEDALMMPISADPQTAQQQRGYLENLKKELGRAMSGPMGHGMEAGAVNLSRQANERTKATNAAQEDARATRRSKADAEAENVIRDAKEYLTEKYGKTPDAEALNGFLRTKGFRADGHKPSENRFDNEVTAKQYYQKHPGADKPVAPAAPATAPVNPNNESIAATKSQLEQMYKAGFIDEAALRRGLNNPLGHKQTIETIYDHYVKQFNPQQPHSPFPENSA